VAPHPTRASLEGSQPMGNVDGVPLASQVKSAVQASRGETEAAWATQRRFTEQCVGAAQIRSLVEFSRGDLNAAAETQRRFLETSRRVLDRSDIVDAVPGMAQLKSTALDHTGEAEAAERTRRNFSNRCPGVSQARSLYDVLVEDRREEAIERQREFLQFASSTVDKVPGIGHAKGWVHHACGDHERAGQALQSANQSVSLGVQSLKSAYQDISSPPRHLNGQHPEGVASVEAAGPLTPTEIRQSTLSFNVTPEQCLSFTACPICLQDFSDGDVGATLRCFHIFHKACAEQWLQQNGNCPVCRVQVHTEASAGSGEPSVRAT